MGEAQDGAQGTEAVHSVHGFGHFSQHGYKVSTCAHFHRLTYTYSVNSEMLLFSISVT